jgi:cell division protein FtsW
MLNLVKKWWRNVDEQLIIAILILFFFSMVLVTTSSASMAARIGLHENYFSSRQVIYLIIASALIIFCSLCDVKSIRRIALGGFLFNIIMLILVKFFGYEVKGATRWISILGFSYQPSEFIKPFFSVVIGWVLSLKYRESFPSIPVSLGLYLLVATLLAIQPDFGMIVIITATFGIQLFVAGLPIIWIVIAFFLMAFGIVAAYLALPHVASRINNYLDPTNSENYQVTKSIMAFEHGGFYGKGPGEGSVKQLLPDSHTDFIFAVAGEEFGAIICLVIISVFMFIIIRMITKIQQEQDKFAKMASVGIISQFALQAIINMGVTINLFPTKGMTLPFISYGGSATLAIGLGIGMLFGLIKRKASLNRYKQQNIHL